MPFPGTSSRFLKGSSSPAALTSQINNKLINNDLSPTSAITSTLGTKQNDMRGKETVLTLPVNPVSAAVPLEKRTRSLEASSSCSRRNSNISNKLNKSAWFKTIVSRIQHTLMKWNEPNENKRDQILDDVSGSEDMDNEQILESEHHNYLLDDSILSTSPSQSLSSSPEQASSSSVFEVCAQTPRHFANETEVLRKVGRFTIVREREDFNTSIFDQCHCQQKPCKFSLNGGAHPVLPPEDLPEYGINAIASPIKIPAYLPLGSRSAPLHDRSSKLLQQQSSNSWSSNPSRSGPHHRLLYYHHSSAATSSMHSLPPSQKSNDSVPCRPIHLIASSPNLARSQSENVYNSRLYKTNLPDKKAIDSPKTVDSVMRSKQLLLNNMKTTDYMMQRQQLIPVTHISPPNTIMSPSSKFMLSQDLCTTINSHTGRKFEVERWSLSSSSSSSSSMASTETASSLATTISSVSRFESSIYSMQDTLTRKCSNLSSKHGRKFEVTVISSDGY